MYLRQYISLQYSYIYVAHIPLYTYMSHWYPALKCPYSFPQTNGAQDYLQKYAKNQKEILIFLEINKHICYIY